MVGCGTEPTRTDEDRGAPLGGVRDFYGKRTLRRTNQSNGARGGVCGKIPYCERRPLAASFFNAASAGS